jgi:SET and MYND domain-containing protein
MVRVEALRDVEKGEELSVSYIDETQTVAQRENALASYGFKCACARCVAETRREAVSDECADVD